MRGLIRRAAGGGQRATSRLSFCARPKRLSSARSFCARPKRLSSARTPPPSLWPSSDGASSPVWRRTRSPRQGWPQPTAAERRSAEPLASPERRSRGSPRGRSSVAWSGFNAVRGVRRSRRLLQRPFFRFCRPPFQASRVSPVVRGFPRCRGLTTVVLSRGNEKQLAARLGGDERRPRGHGAIPCAGSTSSWILSCARRKPRAPWRSSRPLRCGRRSPLEFRSDGQEIPVRSRLAPDRVEQAPLAAAGLRRRRRGGPPRGGLNGVRRGRPVVRAALRLPEHRYTPALAGKPNRTNRRSLPPAVHPRARGEDVDGIASLVGASGTPPRSRGRLSVGRRDDGADRYTPALAGKTHTRRRCRTAAGVHPRARGEDDTFSGANHQEPGTPPRSRGRRREASVSRHPCRYTPALAGMTDPASGKEPSPSSSVSSMPAPRATNSVATFKASARTAASKGLLPCVRTRVQARPAVQEGFDRGHGVPPTPPSAAPPAPRRRWR